MKLLGLIGGMSWESTAVYYRLLNEEIKQALGGLHSARVLLYSVDFAPIAALQAAGQWQEAAAQLIEAGQALKAAGAEALVICTNTMHKVAPDVEAAVQLPLLHIANATGAAIKAQGLASVGLLGTAFTMEQPFYKQRLQDNFGLNIIVPDDEDRARMHHIIYAELCKGVINPASQAQVEAMILRLKAKGAQGVILGCTEIGLLITGADYAGLRVFDTTHLHVKAAARYALQP